MRKDKSLQLRQHLRSLKKCQRCPDMVPPVITPGPTVSKIVLIGQAPGPHEAKFGKPFSWTAGKALFKWFANTGISEEQFREKVYISAVCRCFPGKTKAGSDRVPTLIEIENCSSWIEQEFKILKPSLVIPVGKLAITQLVECKALTEVVGKTLKLKTFDQEYDCIALPHPSGASTWTKTEPGKTLLKKALNRIKRHKVFREAFE